MTAATSTPTATSTSAAEEMAVEIRQPFPREVGARHRNLLGLAIGHLICIGVLMAAAQETANRASIHDQGAWLNLGVVAAIASGLLNGLWLTRLRRATARRRRLLLGHLDKAASAERPGSATARPVASGDEPLVAVPGLTLVHRPECPLVSGKRVEPATSSNGARCGWCRR